ncbi:MAG: hypothetical protein AAFY59_11485, partial [Pseudomonadota bacterium]
MATYYFTLDGSGAQSETTYTLNDIYDTINITITEDLASSPGNYSFVGDFRADPAFDTFNVTLPEGWSIVTTYQTDIGPGTSISRYNLLDQYGNVIADIFKLADDVAVLVQQVVSGDARARADIRLIGCDERPAFRERDIERVKCGIRAE